MVDWGQIRWDSVIQILVAVVTLTFAVVMYRIERNRHLTGVHSLRQQLDALLASAKSQQNQFLNKIPSWTLSEIDVTAYYLAIPHALRPCWGIRRYSTYSLKAALSDVVEKAATINNLLNLIYQTHAQNQINGMNQYKAELLDNTYYADLERFINAAKAQAELFITVPKDKGAYVTILDVNASNKLNLVKETADLGTRATMVGVLLAIFFGLLQALPAKIEGLGVDIGLKVISQSFLSTALIPFALWVACAAAAHGYRTRFQILDALAKFFYDLGVTMTLLLIFITATFLFPVVPLIAWFPSQTFANIIVAIWVLSGIWIACYGLREYVELVTQNAQAWWDRLGRKRALK